MKVVSTEALTKLIQLVKSAFIKVDDVVEVSEIDLATVATTGDYDDLSNKLTAGTTVDITNNVINVTSDISTGAALGTTAVQPADLNNKADTNLLNITSTGKNIANWSTNVSNCITEIPQDIKLELNNGTLILKSGSKVYVPNGSGVYTELITTSDISLSLSVVANTRYFLFATAGTSASSITSIYRQTIENSTSGTTIPTNGVFYDITNNKITAVSSGIQETIKMSFPVCSFSTNSSGTISSIDQIFNGFGYIGSTVFALPGVKGLIPNGRNADGTLKNIELSLTSVIKTQVNGTYNFKFAITSSGIGVYYYDYDDINNYIYRTDTGARYYDRVVCGDVVINNSVITSFTPKTAFHAADYNDLSNKLTAGTGIDITDDVISVTNPTLVNTATGNGSLTIYGTATSQRRAINIGYSSTALAHGVAIGYSADAGEYGVSIGSASDCNSYGIALGFNAHSWNPGSIQIGYGTNSYSGMTMAVGFFNGTSSYEYQLLDGTTGLIPSGRLPVDNSSITINSSGQLQATSERNIGEIIQSILPLTDAGLHLLDGALISGSGSYAAFVTYIAGLVSSYPSAFTTESAWQNTVSSKGVCGKFVYNSTNNTVRLPKITGFIEGTTDTTALGELINAGLPNITGKFTQNDCQVGTYNAGANGAFYMTNNSRGYMYGRMNSSENKGDLGFDASRSSSIYGKSNTVQPQSIKVLYYIVIATSTKTDIQVDIDKIATDLNGKADDNAVVHKSGNETISGPKTFTNTVFAPASGVTNSIVTTTGISKSQNGYVKLGNGIIIQWGSIGNAGSGTITFPTAFTSTNYTITFIGIWNSVGVTYTRETANTTSVFYRCNRSDVSGRWLAIGY